MLQYFTRGKKLLHNTIRPKRCSAVLEDFDSTGETQGNLLVPFHLQWCDPRVFDALLTFNS